MTDILLIQPPVSYTNKIANSGKSDFPIGLVYVGSMLRKHKFSSRILNNSMGDYSIEDIINIIESDKIRILGISALLATIPSAVRLAKAVKNRFGDRVHVMLGNAHISVDNDIIRRYPYFDSGVQGEADHFIVEHVSRILAGEKRLGIFTAAPPKNLDELPIPMLDMVENMAVFKKNSLVPIVGTRGCPYQCGYCARPALSKNVRSRSADSLLAEIESRLHITDSFYFQDDTATISKTHITNFCREVIKRKLKIKFEITTRLDCLTDEIASLLKQAGCRTLLVGIESGNERIRQEVIQKNLSDDQIFRGMQCTKKYNLPVQLLFMLGHPEESHKEAMDSVNFPIKLVKMGFTNIEMVGFHITFPLPSTRYFDWCLKNEKFSANIVDDYIDGKLGDGYAGVWPYLIPNGLTYEDLVDYRKMATRSFFIRPAYIMKRAIHSILNPQQLASDIKNGFYVLTQGSSSDLSKTGKTSSPPAECAS